MKSRGKLTDMDLEDRVDMDNKFDDVKMIESLVESYKDQGLPIGDLVQAQLDQVNSRLKFPLVFQNMYFLQCLNTFKKVSKSRKQIIMSSILPKIERKSLS